MHYVAIEYSASHAQSAYPESTLRYFEPLPTVKHEVIRCDDKLSALKSAQNFAEDWLDPGTQYKILYLGYAE